MAHTALFKSTLRLALWLCYNLQKIIFLCYRIFVMDNAHKSSKENKL